jgi:hypothetical protein
MSAEASTSAAPPAASSSSTSLDPAKEEAIRLYRAVGIKDLWTRFDYLMAVQRFAWLRPTSFAP